MARVWVVLLSLMAAGGSFIYKKSYGSPATGQISSAVALVTANLPDRAASKSDKLDVHPTPILPAKKVIQTIAVTAPVEIVEVKKAAPERPKKIIGRHWRASYARMTRRSLRPTPQIEQAAKPEGTRSRLLNWLKIGG